MKTTIRSLALLLSVAFLLSACVKTKDDETGGSFTLAGNTYNTNQAFYTSVFSTNGQFSYAELAIASADFTRSTFNGRLSGIGIMFDHPTLTEGTYTFEYDNSPQYNSRNHFFSAYVIADVKQYPNLETGHYNDYITSGKITVNVSGERVTVDYDLNFDGELVAGRYSGKFKTLVEEY